MPTVLSEQIFLKIKYLQHSVLVAIIARRTETHTEEQRVSDDRDIEGVRKEQI